MELQAQQLERKPDTYGSIASDFLDVEIDQSNCWIGPLSITNDSEDRDGDRIDPDGLLLVSYEKCPLIYWNHSHQFDQSIFPIGVAENRDKSFGVFREGNTWYSPTRFAQSNQMAMQIFALICEGIIRGRSIGAIAHDIDPIVPTIQTVGLGENGQVMVANPVGSYYRQAEMIEWSWVGIPSNRDITIDRKIQVKSFLSRGRINGEKILPVIAKSLREQFDFREPVAVPGWTKGLKVAGFSGSTKKNGVSQMSGELVGFAFAEDVTVAQVQRFLESVPEFKGASISTDGGVMKAFRPGFKGSAVIKALQGANTTQVKGLYAEKLRDGIVVKSTNQLQQEAEQVQQQRQQNTQQNTQQKPPAKPPAPGGQAPAGKAPAKPPAGQTQPQPNAAQQQQGQPSPGSQKEAMDMLMQAVDGENVAVEPDQQPLAGPAGSQHLQALVRGIAKVLDDAKASIGDVEHPDVLAANDQMIKVASGLVGELRKVHDSVYAGHSGVTCKLCEDCEQEAEEQADPTIKKSLEIARREAFRGHRISVPGRLLTKALSYRRHAPAQAPAPAPAAAPDEAVVRAELLKQLESMGIKSAAPVKSGFDSLLAQVGSVGNFR